jgi:hypothetical protein
MHRTVKDFLEQPDTQELLQEMISIRTGIKFDPSLAILKSMILLMKSTQDNLNSNGCLDDILVSAILHARRAESTVDIEPTLVNKAIDELLQTLFYWMKKDQRIRNMLSTDRVFNSNCTAYTIAVECGLHNYLRHILLQKNIPYEKSHTRDLLSRALQPCFGYDKYLSPRVIGTLVEFEFDPKQSFNFAIEHLKAFSEGNVNNYELTRQSLNHWRDLMVLLLPMQKTIDQAQLDFLLAFRPEWSEVMRHARLYRKANWSDILRAWGTNRRVDGRYYVSS